jgi:hypothetical protein
VYSNKEVPDKATTVLISPDMSLHIQVSHYLWR